MKKTLALVLATMMTVGIAGCNNNNDEGNVQVNAGSSVQDNNEGQENNGEQSVGDVLLKEFTSDTTVSAQEIADRLITNPIIMFSGTTMPVEEGLLAGFDNAEIKGFEEGVMFAPMMGTIPFIGYVFDLPEDADMLEFIQTLKDNANLRWNICTEADEVTVSGVGDKVFFLMSPKTFEEPAEDTAAELAAESQTEMIEGLSENIDEVEAQVDEAMDYVAEQIQDLEQPAAGTEEVKAE